MAHLSKERRGQIQRAVLQVLHENPDGLQAKHVISRVANRLTLTEYEKGEYTTTPGARRFDKILRFSTIGPVKAGWMTKEKGLWTITQAGETVLKEITDPAKLSAESSRLYRAWKREQPDSGAGEEGTADTPDSTTLEEAEETAWSEISDYLSRIGPYDFQKLVAGLLRGMGYHVAWISPPGPDKGIDIIAHTDPLGVDGPRIKVQVKHRQGSVGGPQVREFLGVLRSGDSGLYVSTGGFTRDAQIEAERSREPVSLVDRDEFIRLLLENYESLDPEFKARVPLRKVWVPAE